MLGGGREQLGGTLWHLLTPGEMPPVLAPLKRNELPRKLRAKSGTSPVWWAESPKLGFGGPLRRHRTGPYRIG